MIKQFLESESSWRYTALRLDVFNASHYGNIYFLLWHRSLSIYHSWYRLPSQACTLTPRQNTGLLAISGRLGKLGHRGMQMLPFRRQLRWYGCISVWCQSMAKALKKGLLIRLVEVGIQRVSNATDCCATSPPRMAQRTNYLDPSSNSMYPNWIPNFLFFKIWGEVITPLK